MIPKEIANQLVQLKEKAKTYSTNQNSLLNFEKRDAVDELKKDVNNLYEQLTQLFGNIDTILLGGLIANFEIET